MIKKTIMPKLAHISQTWLDALIPFSYDHSKIYTASELMGLNLLILARSSRVFNILRTGMGTNELE